MRPAATARAALAVAAVGVLLAGCETTQDVSARIGRRLGHQSARTGTTSIGTANRAVRVLRTVVIPGAPAAAAVELANTSAQVQAAIPVLITVRDAHGAIVYRNNTAGIDPSIQRLARLGPHASVWWVDNEVLTGSSAPAASLTAQVGAGSAAGAAPALRASGVQASDSFPGPHVDLTLHNAGAATGADLYAVALKGDRVVGAGRGVVATVPAHASDAAEIVMTGAITGARIVVTIAPAAAG